MSKLRIQTTVNYEFIDDNFGNCRGIVLPGGTRSSKTIATIQWIIIYCLKNTGKEIAICRDTLTNLKRTTLKDFEALCYGYKGFPSLAPSMKINKSDMYATINGNTISFFGLIDDPMRVYGLQTDIFYINEAVSTHKHTFNQLNQRNNEGFILDCNPSEPNSWVYQLEQREDVKFFRTTYLDNPFLPDDIVKEIEGYEPTPENHERGTADERMWSIYGKGQVFKGKEIIYPEWDTYKGTIEEYDNIFYGVDWGFNHPLACTEVIVNGRDLYLREIVYERGLSDMTKVSEPLLQEKAMQEGETYVVCDSSEPRSINALIQLEIPAMAVKKPPGSVLDGIRKCQSYRIHVHEESTNIQNELNNYKWKVDKRTDTVLDIPVKEFDDACDSFRYPIYTFL